VHPVDHEERGNVRIRQCDRDLSNQRRGHLHRLNQAGTQPISKGVEILRRLPQSPLILCSLEFTAAFSASRVIER
jgi:hypothetical protein